MRVNSVFRSLVSLTSLLAFTVALVLVPATAASAAAGESDFVNRLNSLRNSVGLPSLAVYGDLTSIARAHSQRMGEQNLLYHNPSLTVQVTNWQSVGENVGYGGSVADIQNAFYNSPAHRANMVSSTYTQVGIGTWIAPTGRIWVTQVFRKPLVNLAPAPVPAPAPVGFPVSSTLAPTVSAFAGLLGAPLGTEYAVPGGIEQDFQGGDVLWGPSTGGRVVHGSIRDTYRSLGGARSALNLPTTSELPTPDRIGRFNHFLGGSIYWTSWTGAREVRGAIRERWSLLGWEKSALGYPTTNELPTPDRIGRFNHFQNGSIYWTPGTSSREVRGAIRERWALLGWEKSALGYPVTDELGTPDRIGRFNHFQNGSIYWSPATSSREVRGAIRGLWAATGWELGPLGYPVSDEYEVANGRRSDFQRGSIVWDRRTGQTTIV